MFEMTGEKSFFLKMRHESRLTAVLLVVLAVLGVSAQPPSEFISNFFSPSGSAQYNSPIAVAGSIVVVGDPTFMDGTNVVGAIHVLNCTTGSPIACTDVAFLSGSSAGTGSVGAIVGFGTVVAVTYQQDAKTYTIYGAATSSTKTSGGSILLFQCDESFVCTVGAEVVAAGETSASYFGVSIAVSGSTLVVGAVDTSNNSAAYVFECTLFTSCTQQAAVSIPGLSSSSSFGAAVAILDNGAIAVCAPGFAVDGTVFLFAETSPFVYTNVQNLTEILPTNQHDGFGSNLAASGEYLVISATGYYDAYDSPPGVTGALYVFACDLNITSCTFGSKLLPALFSDTNPELGSQFGISVAVTQLGGGSALVLGGAYAYLLVSDNAMQQGAAFLFYCSTPSACNDESPGELYDPNGGAEENFGAGVALTPFVAFATAPGGNSNNGEIASFQCAPTFFGPSCRYNCSNCFSNSVGCEEGFNGGCQCSDGFQGVLCDTCLPGFVGPECVPAGNCTAQLFYETVYPACGNISFSDTLKDISKLPCSANCKAALQAYFFTNLSNSVNDCWQQLYGELTASTITDPFTAAHIIVAPNLNCKLPYTFETSCEKNPDAFAAMLFIDLYQSCSNVVSVANGNATGVSCDSRCADAVDNLATLACPEAAQTLLNGESTQTFIQPSQYFAALQTACSAVNTTNLPDVTVPEHTSTSVVSGAPFISPIGTPLDPEAYVSPQKNCLAFANDLNVPLAGFLLLDINQFIVCCGSNSWLGQDLYVPSNQVCITGCNNSTTIRTFLYDSNNGQCFYNCVYD